jgi:hypothetical protein
MPDPKTSSRHPPNRDPPDRPRAAPRDCLRAKREFADAKHLIAADPASSNSEFRAYLERAPRVIKHCPA